ncbi:hypothetical protein SAMN05444380_10780 [Thermophagus xiamenensis]|uniref:Uncharacterized protein n=1 Tax=Thermophagus xiamenensis TaxID=385682 RepID=A0A1I1YA31_9BACT|nr:hypothetical protein SAMN05444380_10780 [Thermophagus xiamenensis]
MLFITRYLADTRTGVSHTPARVSIKHPFGCQPSTRPGVDQAPIRVSARHPSGCQALTLSGEKVQLEVLNIVRF